MRRLLPSLSLLLLATVVANASASEPEKLPPSGLIRGRVIEAFSGRPLGGAEVTSGDAKAASAADGRFELRVPLGPVTLQVEAEGHLGESQSVVVVAGTPRTIDLYLIERTRFQEQVEVTGALADSDSPAAIPVRPADVLMVAGGADNVFRTLQTLPGVAGTDEFGSRLTVRGGGPDQNLTVMDGVEIHNPYRLFGLTSAFNPETVRSFELYTGAFGARYGDRLSSLLVIENRDGTEAKAFAGATAISITDANAVFEGRLPASAKGSWLVTGRRTYYDLVAERFTDSNLPAFADLQGRATWEPRPGHRVTFFGLRSREATDAVFEGDRAGEQGAFVTAARNDLVSLQYDALLGTRLSARTIAAWYRNTDTLGADAQFRDESRRSNAPGSDDGFSQANVVFDRDLGVRDLSLRHELSWQASGRHLVEGGFELHALETRVAYDIPGDRNPNAANGSSIQGGVGLPSQLDSARRGTRLGAFVQDRWQMMRGLVLQPGLRFDHSDINGRSTLSPRLLATWGGSRATRVKAGLGLYTQSPGYEKLIQSDYFLDLTEARQLDLEHERAFHALLGLERDLRPGLLVRLEGYYKSFDRLIVGRLETEDERTARVATYDFPTDLQDQVPRDAQITSFPVNGARGTAYGFDVYVARRAVSADTRLTGWASYTWGRSDRDAYARRYPFEYDRRHAVSLVGNWRASSKLEIAATARIASGFPRTPVLGLRVAAVEDEADQDQDGNVTEKIPERDPAGLLVWTQNLGTVENLNSAHLPLFARLDLRLNFRPKGPRGRWLFYLDVINALGRKNTGAYDVTLEYDPASDRPRILEKSAQGIPFLPSVGVRFRF